MTLPQADYPRKSGSCGKGFSHSIYKKPAKKIPTHCQLLLHAGAGLQEVILLLALRGAHNAQVAPGRFAVVPQHLVVVLGTFPLAEVGHGIDQRVSPEGRQLLVVLHVLLAQRNLALEARLDRRLPLPAATVAGNFEDHGALLDKSYVVYKTTRKELFLPKVHRCLTSLLFCLKSSAMLLSV